ncbi:hypothetical protein Pmar_PMAR008664 [Perkinsus marinus ATCC 50983]|uniref:Integrase zinc-binding domain-containing protein n=1 Tax=Perkinsus marinus (strain ATCC 50983 / TXsc) TaxID=423536 RepID=C5KWT5_PERM5|nr:hypothetical protein Pmar_PMAR008664 [Perkinsus marinus ATCC 50983]EER11061.1 hypothetical protein Pmar_PMAR008664 [Perkinsus marinus ATCC 50983]|eukprot:XP_002779266.1 hypothetical protein Pmar_PMAR008664 [Perkinsus marinus ATCC 50983]
MPDMLSRLFEREVHLESGQRMKLVDALHGGPGNTGDFPEIFSEPEAEGVGLSWIMRSEGAELMDEDAHDVDIYTLLSAMPSTESFLACCAADSAADEQQPKPFIETLCGCNWDVNGVLTDFLFLHRVFNALRPSAKRVEDVRLEADNVNYLVRSLQQQMKPPFLSCAGPYVHDETAGVYCFRNGSADGGCTYLPVIPKDECCRAFRAKICLDSHRLSKHGNVRSTVASVYDRFYLPRLRMDVRALVKHCFVCQLIRARRTWTQPPGAGPHRTQATAWEPYHDVFVDVLSLGDIKGWSGTTKVLTVYCLHTFHSTWVPTGETTIDVLNSLVRVQTEQGGLRRLWCDNAAYFRSARFPKEVSRLLNGTVSLLPVRSPWRSGGGERAHGIGIKIAKTLLRSQAGFVGRRRPRRKDDVDLESICREVTFLMNTRPLDYANSDEPSGEFVVVTPDQLARGFTRKRGCVLAGGSSTLPISHRVRAVRCYFMNEMFRDMRMAVARSMGYQSLKNKIMKLRLVTQC